MLSLPKVTFNSSLKIALALLYASKPIFFISSSDNEPDSPEGTVLVAFGKFNDKIYFKSKP